MQFFVYLGTILICSFILRNGILGAATGSSIVPCISVYRLIAIKVDPLPIKMAYLVHNAVNMGNVSKSYVFVLVFVFAVVCKYK